MTPRLITNFRSPALYAATLLAAGWGSPCLSAQTLTSSPPSPTPEPIVQLSPFIIEESTDKGYEAENSLSGTRLNTASKFVGAAVTDVTPQLAADLNLFSTDDLINFTPNASSYNGGGLATDPNGNNPLFGPSFYIRGLIVTTTSRDFIKDRVIDDMYNASRISIDRGPNSILFGIGDPGGVINVVPKRAEMKNSYSFGSSIDNWGSHRETFELNQMILPNKVAFYLAGLDEDKETDRTPSGKKSDRLTGSITFEPFKSTSVRVTAEDGKIEDLFVRPWAPAGDAITPYIAAGSQAIPTALQNGGGLFATQTTVTAAQKATEPALAAQLAAAGFAFVPAGTGTNNITVINGTGTPVPTLDALGLVTTATRTVGSASITDPTLVNSPISQTANLLGYGMQQDQSFQNCTVNIDQAVGDNLFISLTYNQQATNNILDVSAGQTNDQLYLDKNPTLLTMTGGIIPNPNYNRYYTLDSTPNAYRIYYDDQTLRASLAYKLDLRDKVDGWLGKVLGHHEFSAMRERVTTEEIEDTFQLRNQSPQSFYGVTPQFPVGALTNAASDAVMLQLHYIDPSQPSTWATPDYFRLYNNTPIYAGSPIPSPGPNGLAPGWMATASIRSLQIIDSQSVVAQDYFWEDRIVGTLGLRRDVSDARGIASTSASNNGVSNYTVNAGDIDPYKGTSTSPVTYSEAMGLTGTEGVIVYPLPWIGFFYNHSENFQPPAATSTDIFGNVLPASRGKGQDYGIKLTLWDGRIFANFSRYSTIQSNLVTTVLRTGLGGGGAATGMQSAMNAIASTLEPLTNDPLYASYPYNNALIWSSSDDETATGYELSVTANLTRNWRFTANFSHQTAVASNYGATEAKWLAAQEAYVNQHYPQYLNTVGAIGNEGVAETVAQDFADIQTVLTQAQTLSGRQDARQPEYTANFVTAYDFTTGLLKGFGVGATYQWRGQYAIGYAFEPGSTVLFNPEKPYWGSNQNPVGLFVNYKFNLPYHVRCRVQFNADAINLNRGLYPFAETDSGNGSPLVTRYAVGPGSTFAFSTRFDY